MRWRIVLAYGFIAALSAGAVAGYAAGLDTLVLEAALAGLLLAAVALSAAVLLRERTLRAVRSVAYGASRLAEGDRDHRVLTTAGGETGLLAEAFNRMADTVRSTIDDLAEERNTLSALLDTMADGVVVVTVDGQIEQINAAARSLLRLDGDRGDPAPYLREPDLLEVVRLSREAGTRLQQDVERLPGSRYVSAIATPLEEGRALLTIHDLTGVRQLDVTRREFVSNVSHELRNPLAALSAIVETLETGALDDREAALDFLARMRGEIDGMSALVSDLLTLSRIESGRERFEPALVDLSALLAVACDRVRQRAERDGVTLELDVASGLTVDGDESRLRQVVDNLLDNALRFTPPGGAINIRGAEEGSIVRIEVSDNGPGIAPEHLPHVFERFYKADPSRHGPGTGLGLAIAKHIVEQHGGTIAVSSSLGSGAGFSVVLPRDRS